MSKLSIITLITFIVGCSFTFKSTAEEVIPIRRDKDTDKPHRPHDEETAVTASYNNGTLYISFESYEGMATATLTNLFTGESDSWTFSTATQPSTHHIGSAPGTYTISITTSEASYQGVFAID